MIINIVLRSLNIFFCLYFLVEHVIFVPPTNTKYQWISISHVFKEALTKKLPLLHPHPRYKKTKVSLSFFLYDNFRKWRSYCHISPAVCYQRAVQYVRWSCQINRRRCHLIWKVEKYRHEIITNTFTLTLHVVINNNLQPDIDVKISTHSLKSAFYNF